MIPQEATVDDDLLAGIHPLASTRREDLEPALDGSLDGIMSRRARGVEGETDTMTTMLALFEGWALAVPRDRVEDAEEVVVESVDVEAEEAVRWVGNADRGVGGGEELEAVAGG